MRLMTRILLVAAIAPLLAGGSCTKRDVVVDTQPPAEVVRKQYVPIPAHLTRPTPIAEGPVDQVLDVARERKAQLQQCNADKAAIAGVEGTKAPC